VLDPSPSRSWNYDTAAHLLNRAAFGGTPEEIEVLCQRGLSAAVSSLIDLTAAATDVPAPDWIHPENLQEVRMEARAGTDAGMQKDQMRAFRRMQGEELRDLRYWWLERMRTTPQPLLEKMTLFWHGHFATSAEKASNSYWIWLQNDTFRRHALGNFVSLTKAISRDPAMMIYLDLQQSRKEKPNENWARELMELFTVGIGNYSEEDIRESARAFTGYRIDRSTQQFQFLPRQHDDGPKTFMGKTGPLNGDDIIDVLAAQPACAAFIAKKLCRFFMEDDPAPKFVEAVAGRIRAHNFEIQPVLRDLFMAAEFYSPRVMRSQIKSPVQYLVQSAKLLGTQLPAPNAALNAMRQMGQVLFAPPNVKGWDGGKSWVSTSTLLFRYNFSNYLINGERRPGAAPLPGRIGPPPPIPEREPVNVAKFIPAELRDKPEELVAFLSRRFFGTSAPEKQRATFTQFLAERAPNTGDQTLRDLLHLMMSTPQFQLA
jgi:uncharacterized protein (DUF1800 family)